MAATTSVASAGGFGIPEIGVRRTAMATIIGRPDDASAVYHNPAGLVLQHGWNLYTSVGLAVLDIELAVKPWDQSERFLGISPEADGYYAPVRPTRAQAVVPMIAATGELIPDKLVVAIGAYVGNASGASFDPDGVTRYHLTDGYIVAPQAVASVAYRVHPTLTLGASVGLIYMRVHLAREVFPIISGTDVSAITGTRPKLELEGSAWAPSWMIAAFGQPHPRITWGATVTGPVNATLEGPVEVTFSEDAGAPGDTLIGRHATSQMLPWSAMAGVAVDVSRHVEIDGEFRYWLYRQYDRQFSEITGIGLIRELETIKNYHDSVAVSAGVRVHSLAALPKLELMAGAQFDRSPAPPQTVTLDQPTFSHPAAHTGLRYQIGRYRFGASYLHYWYIVPQIDDSTTNPPSNVKGRAGNNMFTGSIEVAL